MKLITITDEIGEVVSQKVELDPVDQQGTHWFKLAEAIIKEGLFKAHIEHDTIYYIPTCITKSETFREVAQLQQDRLSHLMTECRKVQIYLRIWQEVSNAGKEGE